MRGHRDGGAVLSKLSRLRVSVNVEQSTVRVENTSFCRSRFCHDGSVAVVLPSLRLTVLSITVGVATIFPFANVKSPCFGEFRSLRDIGNTTTFDLLPLPILIPPSVPGSSLGRGPYSQAC